MRFMKNSALKRRVLYSNDYKPIYITYYIVFPKGETWVNQVEFQNHDKSEQVSWEIDQMTFPIDIKNKLKHKKEADWKDQNGVEHRIVVENVKRQIFGDWAKHTGNRKKYW